MEELEAAFKKALKSLEGEKRAAIKKAKGRNGKKAKEAIAAVEEEYAGKLKDLRSDHEQQLAKVGGGAVGAEGENSTPNPSDKIDAVPAGETQEAKEMSSRERKQAKARRKKERQKAREAQHQKEIEEEVANSGPSLRDVELERIKDVLLPLDLKIVEVKADGNCLYRAVGAQTDRDYTEVRKSCAC